MKDAIATLIGTSGSPSRRSEPGGLRRLSTSCSAFWVALSLLVVPLGARTEGTQVNLLRSTQTTVAVSSAVDNRRFLPRHLVDGDPATAWNSRTGDLLGAWIAFRVPRDAQVDSIRMSAGFTAIDASGRDLFKMNPRIRRIRVWRAGEAIGEHNLDIDDRGLQTIPIGGFPGGDFKIEVIEIRPGSKATWREICVSELEVWGTLATGQVPRTATPAFRIGLLDASETITKDECVTALFPGARGGRVGPGPQDDVVTNVVVIPITEGLAVCRVDRAPTAPITYPDAPDGIAEIAPVVLATRWTARRHLAIGTASSRAEVKGTDISVALAALPLTATETAIVIHVNENDYGAKTNGSATRSTVYRIARAGLDPVLEFRSFDDSGEDTNADFCTVETGAPRRDLPDLRLSCTRHEGRPHGPGPEDKGIRSTSRQTIYRWTGTSYEQRDGSR